MCHEDLLSSYSEMSSSSRLLLGHDSFLIHTWLIRWHDSFLILHIWLIPHSYSTHSYWSWHDSSRILVPHSYITHSSFIHDSFISDRMNRELYESWTVWVTNYAYETRTMWAERVFDGLCPEHHNQHCYHLRGCFLEVDNGSRAVSVENCVYESRTMYTSRTI